MRQAVSVSLGSSTRDKEVTVNLGGTEVLIRREGMDGDLARARQRFAELDSTVDALGLGGFELGIHIGDRHYPLRAGLRLIRDVRNTPVVDGSGLKKTLERDVFNRTPELRTIRYRKALVLVGADRYGMSRAVTEMSDEVLFADFHYALGLPIPIRSLSAMRRVARWTVPVVGWLPARMLYPVGEHQEVSKPRFSSLWQGIDLVAGDIHYIRRNIPPRIDGVTVLTNSTTNRDIEHLKDRGAQRIIMTTPRFEGRSFGTNLLEAAITASAGQVLTVQELGEEVERLDIRPEVLTFGS